MLVVSGARLSPIGDFCTASNSSAGDGIDNDCDDQIDEELDNGVDDDGDGLIGRWQSLRYSALACYQNMMECVEFMRRLIVYT
mgnify:FL=1